MADAENMELVEGYVEPTAEKASFRSIVVFPKGASCPLLFLNNLLLG